MEEKKKFTEPEIVKYQESLDKVTLNNFNCYGGSSDRTKFRDEH